MKFSENWLRILVPAAPSSEALAHALTMAGLEVESIERVQPKFSGVVVGRVLTVDKHPNADRLKLCSVDVGAQAPLRIVCGAPNVALDARVACARVGAVLDGKTIQRAQVRGQESDGMLCSARELGLSEDAAGLMLLAVDAPIGKDLADYLDLDDRLFTLKLTPNRGDCLSLLGVAREVAALAEIPLSRPETEMVPIDSSLLRSVASADPAACPLYCGRVIEGIDPTTPTPLWMKQRLERSGVRPISAVVDVTNYVMLELGQPLHAFDLDKLAGGIVVRWARPGERVGLLNEQTIELEADFLVITDESGPVALAGIMGGQHSAVSDDTRNVLLEAAFFSPHAVAGRSRRLGFASDAVYRFERGVDFGNTRAALERASALIRQICGGRAGPVSEARGELPHREPVRLRAARANKVLGTNLSTEMISAYLNRLGIEVHVTGDTLSAAPPAHRFDLTIEADLIEEVARLHGYERIPATSPGGGVNMPEVSESRIPLADLARALVARDYQEVVSYSFVDGALEAAILGNRDPILLRNPIASQMNVMRSSLATGLIETLRFNVNRKQERVRVFEIGRCFMRAGDLEQDGVAGYRQPLRLAALAYGSVWGEQWGVKGRPIDFFDVKADIGALLDGEVVFRASAVAGLHPGRSAELIRRGHAIGWIGELHPRHVQDLELPSAPILFELDLERASEAQLPSFAEVSRLPAVRRDMAFFVDESVQVGGIREALMKAAPDAVTEIALFDLYRGEGVPEGKKSLAFRVVMQDTEKTLTEDEIEEIVSGLRQTLISHYNAKFRSQQVLP